MGIEKKAALICVVILAVLFGIGLSNREDRPLDRNTGDEVAQEKRQKILLDDLRSGRDRYRSDKDDKKSKDDGRKKERDEPKEDPKDDDKDDAAQPTDGRYVVVEPNDNFWVIAKRELGSSSFYQHLVKANPKVNPRRLRIGQKVFVPSTDAIAKGAVRPSKGEGDSKRSQLYRVQRHETLSGIARDHYGKSSYWKKILAANSDQMVRARDLREGMLIKLP